MKGSPSAPVPAPGESASGLDCPAPATAPAGIVSPRFVTYPLSWSAPGGTATATLDKLCVEAAAAARGVTCWAPTAGLRAEPPFVLAPFMDLQPMHTMQAPHHDSGGPPDLPGFGAPAAASSSSSSSSSFFFLHNSRRHSHHQQQQQHDPSTNTSTSSPARSRDKSFSSLVNREYRDWAVDDGVGDGDADGDGDGDGCNGTAVSRLLENPPGSASTAALMDADVGSGSAAAALTRNAMFSVGAADPAGTGLACVHVRVGLGTAGVHVQPGPEALVNVVPEGKFHTTCAPGASLGPSFRATYPTSYGVEDPTAAPFGGSTASKYTSADVVTVVDVDAPLSPGVGSEPPACVTTAVPTLVTVPGAPGPMEYAMASAFDDAAAATGEP